MAKGLPETTDLEAQLQMWNAAATALAACPEECQAATSAALLTGDVDLVDRMRDVSIRLDSYLSECVSRTSTLEGQRLAADMGTVSEEQLAEWRELYNRFDKDHDGSLNTVELGALLTSLSEARTDDELKALCTDGKCAFPALVEYLKSRETDSHSKAEVAGAFASLAAEEGGLTVASLEKAGVTEDDIEFLVQRMEAGEPNEAGAVTYSFESLIESMFM
ncbi:hypothetical protein KIPB_009121 [Kipferlia bialata]|uniref:EF-hand domain-containing protein n=1 Tax=Kipferlia bialata TaxID=797122 RepID=A0A9K3D2P2_9EUKA|nr:hypothetical protein KIPB_009121 [Kipferlia bialata]|eukprot:g9121.t1